MLINFERNNENIYTTKNNIVMVDDLIEMLERHRGKQFYNGAVETICFYATDEYVQCDDLDTILEQIDDDDLCETIYEECEE